jgi:hypothetical protein
MKMKFSKLKEIISSTISEELQKLNEATKYAVTVKDVGTVLLNAKNVGEAKKIVARQLKHGTKDILDIKKIQLGKQVGKIDDGKIEEKHIEYDYNKVKKIIMKDKFLQRAFKTLRGNDKKKCELIFKNFIHGDKQLEKVYQKI